MNLRLAALAGVVACAVALPLAVASAGGVGDAQHSVVRSPSYAGVTYDDEKATGAGASGGAGASAPGGPSARGSSARAGAGSAEGQAPSAAPTRSPLLLGLGLATAARCGPEVTSPDGIEAQTCVLTQGGQTWARTYYRNTTGRVLESVLSLMGPGGRTVQLRCPVGAEDEPGTCETPREPVHGTPDTYTAVAEFARAGGGGSLLLRAGSNAPQDTGS
ncbi:hypothetical protein AB0E88_32110 [Streptomyces sp. NPDC028635]|uniref:hypothetical protein n=1 Tax=Streptomyces sp. NPDC028635 TaxID=3154800 RepID=UPI0033E1C028